FGRVELVDLRPVLGDPGRAADRDPLSRAVAVVGEVDVGVGGQLVELVALDVRDEPEARAVAPALRLHRPRDEVAVRPPRREHADLDPVDETVQVLQLLLRGYLLRRVVSARPAAHLYHSRDITWSSRRSREVRRMRRAGESALGSGGPAGGNGRRTEKDLRPAGPYRGPAGRPVTHRRPGRHPGVMFA